jgi:hypothetical protein
MRKREVSALKPQSWRASSMVEGGKGGEENSRKQGTIY